MAFCIGHEPVLETRRTVLDWIVCRCTVRVWVWNLVCHTKGRTQTGVGAVGGEERTPSKCDTGAQIETLVVAKLLELTGLLVTKYSSLCLRESPNRSYLGPVESKLYHTSRPVYVYVTCLLLPRPAVSLGVATNNGGRGCEGLMGVSWRGDDDVSDRHRSIDI
jgi:hypothetical protein